MSNIARHFTVAHPRQQFYSILANGSRFNFSGVALAIP